MICTTRSLSVLPAPHHPPPALRRLAFCIKPVWDLFIYYIRFLISSSFLSYLFVSNQGERKPFVSTTRSQEFLLLLWTHCITTISFCIFHIVGQMRIKRCQFLRRSANLLWITAMIVCCYVCIWLIAPIMWTCSYQEWLQRGPSYTLQQWYYATRSTISISWA